MYNFRVLKVMARYSKLQKQVLNLYKCFLRESAHKPGIRGYVQQEFKKNSALPRTDVMRIEHLYRKAERQLEQLKNTQVTSAAKFSRD